MPLFFILSGYTYSYKEKTILKDVKRLLVPYMAVAGCVILSCRIKGELIFYPDYPSMMKAILYGWGVSTDDIYLMGAVWFLPAMFFARRFVNLIFAVTSSEVARVGAFLALVLLGNSISECEWIPGNIDVAMVAAGFIYIGYLLREKKIVFDRNVVVACLLIWFSVRMCIRVSMSARNYEILGLMFAGAVAGSIVTVKLAQQLAGKGPLSRCISFLGRHTLLLLCDNDLSWRLPVSIWPAFLGRFREQWYYVIVTVLWSVVFDIAVMCALLLLWKGCKAAYSSVRIGTKDM